MFTLCILRGSDHWNSKDIPLVTGIKWQGYFMPNFIICKIEMQLQSIEF